MTRLLTALLALCLFASPALASGDGGHGGGGESKGGGFMSSGPTFINVGPILLPIILDDGAQSNLTILISLQVKDLSTSDKVREKMPRLMDAYMRALYGKFDSSNLQNGKLVNLDFIKNKLMRTTQAVVGNDIVQDVLIQAVAQRPLTPG